MLEVCTWEPDAIWGKLRLCLQVKGVPFILHSIDNANDGPALRPANPFWRRRMSKVADMPIIAAPGPKSGRWG